MNELDHIYWETRYKKQNTGWDAGAITTPIKTYVDGLKNKDLKILIPGAGNAHEAIYLFMQGFSNVFVCDWAPTPLDNLAANCPKFPKTQMLYADFFQLKEQNFDLIIEQTFFCALNPALRSLYVKKVADLLQPEGKLVGLLFNFPLTKDGPPFGGNANLYHMLFSTQFKKIKIQDCYNSIKPRMGSEYFIQIAK